MRHVFYVSMLIIILLTSACSSSTNESSGPPAVREDPLLRMPGTQPGQVTLESSTGCYECHGGAKGPWVRSTPDLRNRPGNNYDEYDIYKAWQGSMMGNSARDPLMFACFTVSAQDSMFALGTPNAVDMCLRCHFPKGWLEGRSSTLNASAMTGEDYDGIQCSFCHRLMDPFYKTTYAGKGEEPTWTTVLWDEQNNVTVASLRYTSQFRALETYLADSLISPSFTTFSGGAFHLNGAPVSPQYVEAAGGQYFVSPTQEYRGPFADVASSPHATQYSRFHKSKFFCATCHDVSNPVIGNMAQKNVKPGQNVPLTSETTSAFAWSHVERTYSEFRLSAYNAEGGSPGKGNFKPYTGPKNVPPPAGYWETDQPGNNISKCQDCHMCSRWSPGSNDPNSPVRPEGSSEHPNTWTPCHAMTGGNVWMTSILSSIAPDNPLQDLGNVSLLVRPDILTMDVMQGSWSNLKPPRINPAWVTPSLTDALNLAATRIRGVLGNAANITDLNYSPSTGNLSFRVQNNSGHKLISGFPEGRRMFVNVKVYNGSTLAYEVNPYDYTVGTLKGLTGTLSSPPLAANEVHLDDYVYEAKLGSTLTGEKTTFHFALATHQYKDNRIPPKGFNIAAAAARLSQPFSQGVAAPAYFSAAEYAGGYDEISLQVPVGATRIEVNLYYQTTSREYIEFLRDEINGDGRKTLPATAYVIQTDPFFTRLKAWGNTIFQLWDRNKNMDGAKPFLMTKGVWTAP
ncbi:MAG: hypothetical protein PHI31_14700 [Desulfuromonadaceae bacterium]|nr:hypothetical protein [Desulfuromonadaceae bacterium]